MDLFWYDRTYLEQGKDTHYFHWDEVQIIDKKQYWRGMRKLKEAVYNSSSTKSIKSDLNIMQFSMWN